MESIPAKWISLVEDQHSAQQGHMQAGVRARKWYKGKEQYSQEDEFSWNSDLVRGNLWHRDVRLMAASLFSDDFRICVQSRLRDPEFAHFAEAITEMATRVAEETHLHDEIKATYLSAKFDNIGWAKLHWDDFRQIPTYRWCEGIVVMDPLGHGLPSRARWVCEIVERPLSVVLADISLDQSKRNKLREQLSQSSEQRIDFERSVKMYYVWSKEGATPWRRPEGRKLIIICDEMQDDFMHKGDWPWPFVDADAFPLSMLRLDWIPGETYGVTPFESVESTLRQYNWLSSFLQASVRREVTKKTLYATGAIKKPEQLTSGQHLEAIEVESSDIEKAVKVIDFTGKGSTEARAGLELVKAQHDEQTGITDILRGQALGERTTATETRTLSQNSAIVVKSEGRTVDKFANEIIRNLILAIIWYVPQWSRVIKAIDDPVMLAAGPATKEIKTQVWEPQSGQWVDMGVTEEEVEQIGVNADDFPDGHILRPGVDAWIGKHHAVAWMRYDVGQLRRDFSFQVEAGSSNSEYSNEEQRKATTMLQMVGPILQGMGLMEQYYELVKYFIMSMKVPNPGRFLPPVDLFAASYTPQGSPNPAEGGAPGKEDNATPMQQPGAQTQGIGFGQNGEPQPNGAPSAEMGI